MRITLRSIFIILTVFCLFLGRHVTNARMQAEAVAKVHSMGGEVWYDFEFFTTARDYLNLPQRGPRWPSWLESRLGVDMLHDVHAVRLPGRSDLKPLHGFHGLTDLDLLGSPLSVKGIEELSRLRNLRKLSVGRVQERDKSLAELSTLTQLNTLVIRTLVLTEDESRRLQQQLPRCTVYVFHVSDDGSTRRQ